MMRDEILSAAFPPYFRAVQRNAVIDNCIFHKLKVCGNPALSKSVDTIFPAAFAHFSLCYVFCVLTKQFGLLYLITDKCVQVIKLSHK